MTIDWGRIAPVIVSILIIIAVAILRNYSKTLAAIFATMPINIPLGLWVVYGGGDMTNDALAAFTTNMFWNMFPTVLFIGVVVLAVKASWPLLTSIGVGYVAWGVSLAALTLLRGWLGF
jgi:hypothetical protein